MNFPQFISFTVTNKCNLRCRMCGQWSENGYIKNEIKDRNSRLDVSVWKRLVDEISMHKIRFVLIRGGEPFLYKDIMELLEYINSKGIFLSIDTNGTIIDKFAEELVKLDKMHITFSVDGPEEIHDRVRGVKGSFNKIKANIALLNRLEEQNPGKISKSICFTISRYNYLGLGNMPDVVRSLGIKSINIVPYYYYSAEVGSKYEEELKTNFNCTAFSWKGFFHEDSEVDTDKFIEQHKKYLANLDGIEDFPYMPLSDDEYKTWYSDSITPVGPLKCENVENLIDIQPDGSVNFCVDLPDYSFGNIKDSSIMELWNSPAADKFRNYRRQKPLAACYRCGAKLISEIKE